MFVFGGNCEGTGAQARDSLPHRAHGVWHGWVPGSSRAQVVRRSYGEGLNGMVSPGLFDLSGWTHSWSGHALKAPPGW